MYIRGLDGIWKVTALGPARVFNLLGDRKIISGIAGYNVAGGKKWGWFSIEPDGTGLMLNYDDVRNPNILRGVRDRIIRDETGWTGVFYLHGRKIFRFKLDRAV